MWSDLALTSFLPFWEAAGHRNRLEILCSDRLNYWKGMCWNKPAENAWAGVQRQGNFTKNRCLPAGPKIARATIEGEEVVTSFFLLRQWHPLVLAQPEMEKMGRRCQSGWGSDVLR
jgi:hypothetical protein